MRFRILGARMGFRRCAWSTRRMLWGAEEEGVSDVGDADVCGMFEDYAGAG